jgi:VanZ family protein
MPASAVRPFLQRTSTWLGIYLLWFVILTILSSLSQPGPKVEMVGFDKIVHTIWFMLGGAALALALCYRMPRQAPAWRSIFFIVLLTGALVGGLDEWHQSFTPGRQGLDVYDWAADVLGSLLAVPLARWISRWPGLRADRP